MSDRNAIAAPQPVEETNSGDGAFVALDMKTPREQLPPGTASRHENGRFNVGAEPRKGTRTPIFANLGYPAGPFLGSGAYSNPNGYDMMLIALPGMSGVYAIRSGTMPQYIPVAGPLSAAVQFTQHYDKVLLQQADPSLPTYIWDGLSAAIGFVALMADDLGGGIQQIPNAPFGIHFEGRNWFPVPGDPNSAGASDTPSNSGPGYDRWDSYFHDFNVNVGVADHFVGFAPYLFHTLLIGRSRSIGMLANIPGDLGDAYLNAFLGGYSSSGGAPPPVAEIVSLNIGFAAQQCSLLIGSEVHFLSNTGASGGIFRIVNTSSTSSVLRLEVNPAPLSEPIEPLMKRINWAAAGGSLAQQAGIYSYFVFPIDGSPFNNAIAVRNNASGAWQGIDRWPDDATVPMRIDNLIQSDYYGSVRLYAINHAAGRIHLLYEGADDQLGVASGEPLEEQETYPIRHLLESRAWQPLLQDFKRLEIPILSLNPALTVSLVVEDPEDVRDLPGMPIVKDRRKYKIYGLPDYALDNRNADFAVAQREDYAVLVGDGIELGDGVPLARLAPGLLDFPLETKGRSVSVQIVNTSGEVHILSLLLKSAEKQRTDRRAA